VRIACLRVPDLPLVAERRARPELEGRPVAVAAGPGPRAELVAVSAEGRRRGVHPGSTAAQGRAICAGLTVCVASPARERAARDALLDVALSVAPRAAPAPTPAGSRPWAAEAAVFLDASGVSALFRSEAGFAGAAVERARRVGLPAVAAVAGSRAVAEIAARTLDAPGATRVVPPGEEPAFLAPLPLDLADPDDALAGALARLGVRRLGELARLPRRSLASRLGAEALRLASLARGEARSPALPPPEAPRLEEATDLEAPVERLEPLAFVLRGLLSRLGARLALRGLGCGDLELSLALEGGAEDARRVGVASPTDDPRVLLRLVCLALETHPPASAVEAVCVATRPLPVRRDQLDLFRPPGPPPALLGRTLVELEALCGEGRMGSPEPADDHRPDAFTLRPFAPAPRDPAAPAGADSPTLALRMLRPPAPARVRSAAGRPVWLESAVARGAVVAAAGPWRTSGGWWCPARRFAVEHFDVQTADGGVVRLRFDALRRSWCVDAVYD